MFSICTFQYSLYFEQHKYHLLALQDRHSPATYFYNSHITWYKKAKSIYDMLFAVILFAVYINVFANSIGDSWRILIDLMHNDVTRLDAARNAGLSSHRTGILNNSKWLLSKFSRAMTTKTSILAGIKPCDVIMHKIYWHTLISVQNMQNSTPYPLPPRMISLIGNSFPFLTVMRISAL